MTDAELKAIIEKSKGIGLAIDCAAALLQKINRLESHVEYAPLISQLKSAAEQGDFRGRVLEINFSDYFIRRQVRLQYGAKQGMSGDIDFLWRIDGNHLFIEMKLLRQCQYTAHDMLSQLKEREFSFNEITEATRDVARIQRDIFEKSSTKKFNPKPKANWINLVAVDVSELQLGMIDIIDCLVAIGGYASLEEHSCEFQEYSAVVGVFESLNKQLTAKQCEWLKLYHKSSATSAPHPREYIHGVMFLFRDPRETAALAYDIKCILVWNPTLIDCQRAKNISVIIYDVIPELENC